MSTYFALCILYCLYCFAFCILFCLHYLLFCVYYFVYIIYYFVYIILSTLFRFCLNCHVIMVYASWRLFSLPV